jgi:hypothetical protein
VRLLVSVLVIGLLVTIGLSGCMSPVPPAGGGAPSVATECRGDADDPQPGDMICYSRKLADRLEITRGGTPEAPITYAGGGSTTVPGIRIETDHVIVQGFISDGADSTGIWASGDGVTIQDNVITQVRWTGETSTGSGSSATVSAFFATRCATWRALTTSATRTWTACRPTRRPGRAARMW